MNRDQLVDRVVVFIGMTGVKSSAPTYGRDNFHFSDLVVGHCVIENDQLAQLALPKTTIDISVVREGVAETCPSFARRQWCRRNGITAIHR